MEALSGLSRRDLQSLAKDLGIKANGTSESLRKSIIVAQGHTEGARREPKPDASLDLPDQRVARDEAWHGVR